ncbi:MAG: Jag N-terminal domain-containing protein, partial [Oscillospiraceae bacterium]|nr:Jag N-terminal domain-containing protein [Oscillospiraceae bacterium]
TGKSIDAAVASALEQLTLDRDSVSVEVLDNPKKGVFGLGAQPARIKVTYEGPDEAPKAPEAPAAPKAALSAASRTSPKAERPTPATKAERPAPAPKAERPAPAPKAERPAPAPKAERPAPAPKTERPAPAPKAEPLTPYTAPEVGSFAANAETFLKGLLEHMGSDAVPQGVMTDKSTCSVELVGENLGMLIGRRGETLDAIQHLANYAVNHTTGDRIHINVDAENYRLKREQSLERLAEKVASKVVKYRRNVTLEPMNAYERHVIHATLQDVPSISTYSTGTEPNRRVVVAYNRYQNNAQK